MDLQSLWVIQLSEVTLIKHVEYHIISYCGNIGMMREEACGAVACVLVFGSGGQRFKPHCSLHVVVSLRHFTPKYSSGVCPQY